MKHSTDDGLLQSNLLQAFQKNKIIQGKLNERQRLYYVELVKDMQEHKLKEKLNKELLYTWKKETYVRQLKKNLQDYERKRFGVRDAYYDYQARNLDAIIAGEHGLVIPPQEEERRLTVNAKYNQFLTEYPLKTKQSVRVTQSAQIPPIETHHDKHEETDYHGVAETWKQIHAQSAVGLRKKRAKFLPNLQRASTMDDIRRSNALTKNLMPPTVAVISSVLVTTTPDLVNAPTDANKDQTATQTSKTNLNHSSMVEGIEPVLISSETLKKQTRADLVTMRSVRRPQRNPIDLNMVFESRKRIYQINKRMFSYQLCHRKCALQYNSRFERPQKVEPADDDDNLLMEMNDGTRRRYEDRHQADRAFV